jgi:hypothetical protein
LFSVLGLGLGPDPNLLLGFMAGLSEKLPFHFF